MHEVYAGGMKLRSTILLSSGLLALSSADLPVSAQSFSRGDEQKQARRAMLDGDVMPFSIIKRRIEAEMGDATYVGVAPPPKEGIYRMQFLRKDGKVLWVDVDGKTGNIIARTR